jgi:hypothetical protein
VEKQMECRLAGETEVLGENLPQRHFCPSQNPTWPDTGLNPGRRGGKPVTNRLRYGAAISHRVANILIYDRISNSREHDGATLTAILRGSGQSYILLLHRLRTGPEEWCWSPVRACDILTSFSFRHSVETGSGAHMDSWVPENISPR